MSGIISDNVGRASGVIAAAGGGKVLQVVSTEFTATASSTTATNTFSSNYFSVAITPAATSSKILVIATVNCGMGNNNYNMGIRLVRDTTAIGSTGASTGDRMLGFCTSRIELHNNECFSINYLDSPSSTSELVYGIQGTMQSSGTALYVNRTGDDSDGEGEGRPVSHITVIEIGA